MKHTFFILKTCRQNSSYQINGTDPLKCIPGCRQTCSVLECKCDAIEIINRNGTIFCNIYQYDDLLSVKNEGLLVDEFSTTIVVAKQLRKQFAYAQVSFRHEDQRPELVMNNSITYIPVKSGKNNFDIQNTSVLPTRLHTFNYHGYMTSHDDYFGSNNSPELFPDSDANFNDATKSSNTFIRKNLNAHALVVS